MDDHFFMKMAINLAKQGVGYTSPNPVVGAVVVKNGQVVGTGFHQAAGKAHAEVNALDAAGPLSKGADLFVTLEPCNHFGQTPPCTDKILGAGIHRVVFAMGDPNPGVKGQGAARLKQEGIEVVTGICENEAQKLNEAFIKYVLTKRPFVIAKVAATLDGRIATRTGDAKWISGPSSRQWVHRLRHAVDAIMVGVNTVKMDNPHLTTRIEDGDGSDPVRIILDTSLSIPDDANILQIESASDTILVVGESKLAERRNAKKKVRLEDKGVRIMGTPLKNGWIDLNILMDRLGVMKITSLLIEGGSRLMGSAFKSSVIDKVVFFYAPKVLGGNDGYPVCAGSGAGSMAKCIPITSLSVHRFEDDVMIEGYVSNRQAADGSLEAFEK
jgi:diaminohydroxyphosphoribosylaminopyrimidine deaminase/5-amino-6-(5-phosphoribosylamino)uracil reductase